MENLKINKIIQIISKNTKINSKLISEKSCAQDFAKWDSLAHLRIMLEIENYFKKKISTSKMSDLDTVEKIFKFINN